MMDIVEAVRGITNEELSNLWMPQLGIVTSVYPHSEDSDKDNYECDVRLKNPDLEIRRVQVATQLIGLAGIPNVGDLVLVIFANGDINYPIMVGRLYNDEDRPPKNSSDEVVYIPPHDENSDVRRLYLEFPSGLKLTITDDKADLTAGDTSIVVNRDGDVQIKSKGNVSVSAEGDASIESEGDMSISGSNVKIESQKAMDLECGTDLKLESKNNADLKASNIGMEANASLSAKSQADLSVDASGPLSLKSKATATLESNAVTTVKGAVVKLN